MKPVEGREEMLPIGRLRYLRPLQQQVNLLWSRSQPNERHLPLGMIAGLRRRMRSQVLLAPACRFPMVPSARGFAGYRSDPERSLIPGVSWRHAQLREHALSRAPGRGAGAEAEYK